MRAEKYLTLVIGGGMERVVESQTPEVSVLGLRNGVRYSFEVFAVTGNGRSEGSEIVWATPTTGVEGVVAGLIVEFTTDVEEGQALVPGEERLENATDLPAVDLTVGAKVSDDAVLVELSEPVALAEAEQIAADLQADPAVAWAEPDQFLFTAADPAPDTATSSAAPVPSQEWNLSGTYGVDAVQLEDRESAGQGVSVAVIDTGITSHPDLQSRVVSGYDFVSSPEQLMASRQANAPPVPFDADSENPETFGAIGRDANPADPGDWSQTVPVRNSSWHGTKMAGLIHDVAPGASIQPIRALSWRGGLLSDIAASITWASGGTVDGVPANAHPSKVVNMSFAVEATCPVALQDAITGARERGSILIAAAGNANDDAAKYAPGNCNGVITVGSTTSSGVRADYSNYGPVVDIAAPGGDTSAPVQAASNTGFTSPDQPTRAGDFGTSVSAAHVSAGAALLAARNTTITPDDAFTALTGRDSVKAFANPTCDTNPDYSCGAGILTLAQIATISSGDQDYAMLFTRSAETAASASNSSMLSTLSGDFTFEAWAKPTNCSSGEHTVVSKELTIVFSCRNGTWQYALGNGSSWHGLTGYDPWYDTGIAQLPGQWQHVAVTRTGTGGAIKFYFNGALANTRAAASLALGNSTSYDLFVGGRTGPSQNFDGAIDEVRIYSVDRSASIATDMHTYGPTSTTGLIAYYDFNEGPAGTTGTGTVYNRSVSTDALPASNLRTVSGPTYTDIKQTTSNGSNTVVTFPRSYLTAAGGWRVPTGVASANALIVAGGGGGGNDTGAGGGGGAAKPYSANAPIVAGATVVVTVGQGGIGASTVNSTGANGQPSQLNAVVVGGGGGGASYNSSGTTRGADAPLGSPAYALRGSGGGGANNSAGGSGAFAGGNGFTDTGAGGGGASAAGSNAESRASGNGGNGGAGLSNAITGASLTYGSGGGGGSWNTAGTGGSGAGNGGHNTPATSGSANRGGGGGGGSSQGSSKVGGSGGSGVVIVSYNTAAAATCIPEESQYTAGGTAYKVVAFKNTGSCTWTVPSGVTTVDAVLVAGGGGGGGSIGGGGGAGEFVSRSAVAVTAGSAQTIVVGAGGSPGQANGSGGNGGNSSALSTTVKGGGGGATLQYAAAVGGSGGGGLSCGYSASLATGAGTSTLASGSVNNGGSGSTVGSQNCVAGGGGGAGGSGGNSSGQSGGAGGAGVSNSITGAAVLYSGGGGGGINGDNAALSSGTAGAGGSGIGGAGGGKYPSTNLNGNAAVANTGSGGGGASNAAYGGAGGSGIVILRYAITPSTTCSGSATTSADGYVIVAFKTAQTCTWTPPQGVASVDYLVVAGGGGGGVGRGGGGGAGGMQTGSLAVTAGNATTVTVGAGGAGGANDSRGTSGGSSVLGSITSTGGGGGGGWGGVQTGASGGSGGGGAGSTNASYSGGAGMAGQGNNGGSSAATSGSCAIANQSCSGGGGGGAGAAGAQGSTTVGGSGGDGNSVAWISSSVASSLGVGETSAGTVYFAGGGGGGALGGQTGGSGGLGGGGDGRATSGATPLAAIANTGGGGGGNEGFAGPGGAGGSGVVILRYQSPTCAPLEYSYTSGVTPYTVFEFQGAGSCAWSVPAGVNSVDVLAVGGGGGGGSRIGGGGGGGGVTSSSNLGVTSGGSVSVTVGAGGAGGTSTSGGSTSSGGTGGSSSFGSITALGGGGGGSDGTTYVATSGATGGGVGYPGGCPGTVAPGTVGSGAAGGNCVI
ncbi:MAG: hypothetical protein FJW97_06600, partial [Actinobacteria bacterium]|nr:hypothetical protein [Actinomycetota bacterium]